MRRVRAILVSVVLLAACGEDGSVDASVEADGGIVDLAAADAALTPASGPCSVDNGGCGAVGDFTCEEPAAAPPRCVPIDVCLIANGGCSTDAVCVDLSISRECSCKPGFTGDGITCAIATGDCANANGGCDARATCVDTSPGHTCACNTGYAGDGVTCAPIDCGALAAPDKGRVIAPLTTYLATASYACDPGHALVGGTVLRGCQADGTWTGTAPSCVEVQCGPPPVPKHGSVSATTTNLDSIATYACNPLFQLSSAATRTCSVVGWGAPPTCVATNPPLSPFSVDDTSRLVVMEYENWFGRDAASGYYAQSFHYTENGVVKQRHVALPILSSSNMPLGYDSADENVIRQHALWFQDMHVDAVLLDMSNAVTCTFKPTPLGDYCAQSPALWTLLRTIKSNIQTLYEMYDDMEMPVRIIGMLGAQRPFGSPVGEYLNYPDPSSTQNTLEHALQFYYDLGVAHPNQVVNYLGKPLVVIFMGIADYNTDVQAVLAAVDVAKTKSGQLFKDLLTIRLQTGYTDDQSPYWDPLVEGNGIAGLHQIKAGPPVWSFIDRLSEDHARRPAYSLYAGRPENFTVAMGFSGLGRLGYSTNWGRNYATLTDPAGFDYNLWVGPAPTDDEVVQMGARLRSPEVLRDFMCIAAELRPTFLLVAQFNEYASPDQGWNAGHVHDIEPTNLWTKAESVDVVAAQMAEYKAGTGSPLCPRLFNVSTRALVQTGAGVEIGGFVIGGATPKTVLITAAGPSLPNSITARLANPQIELRDAGGTLIISNDDWMSAPNAAAIQAAGPPANALEPAILRTLAPGSYTVVVSGVADGTGVALLNMTEQDRPGTPIKNFSTRGSVQTGEGVMITGFVIGGATPKQVLLRARGPSLPIGGALANPVLQLLSGVSVIAANDDWQSAANATDIAATGKAPSNPLESAILVTLAPGAYTAIVTGAVGGTGIGIVELFAL